MDISNSSPRRKCRARAQEPPGYWHTHQCDRWATGVAQGMPVCTQHARMADQRPHLVDQWRREAERENRR
jgi:hypothetical protein